MNQPSHFIARGTHYFIDLYRGWFMFGFTTFLYIIIKMLILIDNVILLMILLLYYHYNSSNANTDGPSLFLPIQ